MNTVLAFDPGIRCSGIAIFQDGVLKSCMLAQAPPGPRDAEGALNMMEAVVEEIRDYEPDILVYERQQVYGRGGNADDLLQLAYVNGAVAAAIMCPSKGYLPREWKKQVPKHIHQPRIIARLTEGEKELMEVALSYYAKGLRHNAVDAIGIGLKYLRRM